MTDPLVTLFGGGGFVGRYVVQALMKQGARVRIAQRDPRAALFLRPQGGLGQTDFVAVDVRKPASVAAALRGATAAVNLVGTLAGDFDGLQVQGARNVAEAAREAGLEAVVQVSAIGADADARSRYGRTKAEGEAAVRVAFPNATVVRPSIVFGREDQFLNRFAGLIRMLPVVPVIRGGTRFQPIYVLDLARAIAAATLDPATHGGRTYELGGPEAISMMALHERLAAMIGRAPRLQPVPDFAAGLIAGVGSFVPGAPITGDQFAMLQKDNVPSEGLPGLDAFGIDPTPMETVAPDWLVKFRRGGRFGAGAEATRT